MKISSMTIIDRLQNHIRCLGPKCENRGIMALAADHVADLERQLQEARGRCKYRFDNYCIAGFPCRCGLSHDTNTAGEPE